MTVKRALSAVAALLISVGCGSDRATGGAAWEVDEAADPTPVSYADRPITGRACPDNGTAHGPIPTQEDYLRELVRARWAHVDLVPPDTVTGSEWFELGPRGVMTVGKSSYNPAYPGSRVIDWETSGTWHVDQSGVVDRSWNRDSDPDRAVRMRETFAPVEHRLALELGVGVPVQDRAWALGGMRPETSSRCVYRGVTLGDSYFGRENVRVERAVQFLRPIDGAAGCALRMSLDASVLVEAYGMDVERDYSFDFECRMHRRADGWTMIAVDGFDTSQIDRLRDQWTDHLRDVGVVGDVNRSVAMVFAQLLLPRFWLSPDRNLLVAPSKWNRATLVDPLEAEPLD